MKALFAILALFSASSLLAAQVEQAHSVTVSGYKNTDREEVIELVQTSEYKKVVLDCASFLHGLELTTSQSSEFFFLHESECEKLAQFIQDDSAEKIKSCMIVDFEDGSVRYLKNQVCE